MDTYIDILEYGSVVHNSISSTWEMEARESEVQG